MKKEKRMEHVKRSPFIVLAIVPVLFLTLMVAHYKVNVPVWDQWGLVPLLEKTYNHTLNFGDLWEFHNEHRIVFPKIIMLVLAHMSGWDISYELFLNIIFASGIFIILIYQVRKTCFAQTGLSYIWLIPVISVIVFSLNQTENWLWGWNIQILLNVLAVVGGIVLLTSSELNYWKFMLALLLGILATYSYATGIVYWLMGIILFFVLPLGNKKRKFFIFFWGLIGTACISSYILGFQRPPYHPAITSFIKFPLKYLQYVATYLGASLFTSDVRPFIAFLAGISGLIMFGTFSTLLLKYYKIKLRTILPWLSLSFYALSVALLTGVGRMGFGDIQAMSSRYVSFSNLFWITILIFLYILIKENSITLHQKRKWPCRQRFKFILLTIAGMIIFLVIQSSLHSTLLFRERKDWLIPARSELYSLKNEELLNRIYPHILSIDRKEFRHRLEFLKRQKLSVFKDHND